MAMGELQKSIILYLAGKAYSKCATLSELVREVGARVSKSKYQKHQVLKALSKLARRGWIRRGWIRDTKGRKARIYCLRGVTHE